MSTEKMKLSFDIKKVGSQSANAGLGILGFCAGNLAFNKAVPATFRTGWKALIVTLVMFAVGAFVSTQTKNERVQSTALGWNVYSGVKLVNSLTGFTPEVSGLSGFGFALPQGITNALKTVVPNLGEADEIYNVNGLQIFGPETQIAAVDAEYEIVNGLFGLGASDDLILPAINGDEDNQIAGRGLFKNVLKTAGNLAPHNLINRAIGKKNTCQIHGVDVEIG